MIGTCHYYAAIKDQIRTQGFGPLLICQKTPTESSFPPIFERLKKPSRWSPSFAVTISICLTDHMWAHGLCSSMQTHVNLVATSNGSRFDQCGKACHALSH